MSDKTLQSFFDTAGPVTLNNCDAEAVHRSGAVQRDCVFLAFSSTTTDLAYWSENAPDIGLPLPAAPPDQFVDINGITIASLLPEFEDELADLIADPVNRHQHTALSDTLTLNGRHYDVVACSVPGFLFVELLPCAEITARELKTKMRVANKATGGILSAPDLDTAAQIAVDAIRQLTGFDRVLIYEFLPDGSGKVRAESLGPIMTSYLGLHFPETDIPKQARYLATILPFRFGFSTQDDINRVRGADGLAGGALDMTWSLGRSVSTMHTAYLRNMGVGSSFTAGLMDGQALWGLISCHGSAEVRVAYDVWGLLRDIGDTFMAKRAQEQQVANAAKIKAMRALESDVAVHLRRESKIEDVLREYAQQLRDFLDADGFAFQFDNEIHCVGSVPPKAFIRQLIKWVAERNDKADYFQSNALHREWADARAHIDTACGVLVQPVIIYRVCQLVWFRGPVTKTVNWAGDPNAKPIEVSKDGTHILHPRQSFAKWVSTHREESIEWTQEEINGARETFKDVLDIIASQAQNLKRMNHELQLSQEETREELAQFAYAAAHDIQNPINTITSALEMIETAQGDNPDPAVQKSMDFARRSSTRLRNLADQMANFISLGRREIEPEMVSLGDVTEDALKMLNQMISESEATFDIPELPMIAGSRDLLTILFLNLFSNAMKYRDPEQPPVISVGCHQRDHFVRLTVEDNGLGIKPEYADRIFKPFDRLHRADEIPGSGLGLATCKRIAELHKTALTLDPEYTDGARFAIDFTTQIWTNDIPN